ncbi:hypothetical protein GGS20DRAFT_424677 [Poronia punctata]|nr:hypothetical protein GGS20DRAFT_424677 [Poronia punctata]
MVVSFLKAATSEFLNPQRKHEEAIEDYVSTVSGPSPSLWPEPPLAPSNTQRSTSVVQSGREGKHTADNASSDLANTGKQDAHGSTFPQLRSKNCGPPASKPIEISRVSVPGLFEPHYPTWHSYPPIHPKKFEEPKSCTPVDDNGPADSTATFLRQSVAFQQWLECKKAELTHLGRGPAYEELFQAIQEYERLATQGTSPPIQAKAEQTMSKIKAEMARIREQTFAEERQHFQDMENEVVSSGSLRSLRSHEQEASRQRHMSPIPRSEPKQSLSRVESLLGSDGSSPTVFHWGRQPPVPADATKPSSAAPEDASTKGAENPPSLTAMANTFTKAPEPYAILVPDWFPVAEARGSFQIIGATVQDRYKSLCNYIYDLERAKEQHEYHKKHPEEEGVLRDHNWDKNIHPPNPGWPREYQRRHGGLWKCRKGRTASKAEKNCKLCKDEPRREMSDPATAFNEVMEQINQAMKIVAENDKMEILKRSNNKTKNSSSNNSNNTTAYRGLRISDPPAATKVDRVNVNYHPLRGLELDYAEDVRPPQPPMRYQRQEIVYEDVDVKGKGRA